MITVGRVVGGSTKDNILIRLNKDANVDVGDILVVRENNVKFFLKVIEVFLQSSIPSQHLENIAWKVSNSDEKLLLFDEEERLYSIAKAKVLKIMSEKFLPPRKIPKYFSEVKIVDKEDFSFLSNKGEIPIGYLRLGTKYLNDIVVSLPANKLLRHHMLIVAATGKGKSNFAKVFLKGLLSLNKYSVVVFDPHGEYYGSKGVKGLRDDENKDNIVYFTPSNLFPGSENLKIYTQDLRPSDFYGVVSLTDAQRQLLDWLYKAYKEKWIINLFVGNAQELLKKSGSMELTLISLKRKLKYILGLTDDLDGFIFSNKIREEESIFSKIKTNLENRKMVIIDTSLVSGESELLISSCITNRIFNYYRLQKQKNMNNFSSLPELLILFEEAPRVLGREVLSKGTNIFERVAREGRKFKVGICAITQIPSLLPKEILSQMNTKVILGITSPQDRDAIINSSTHVISDESSEIQMLDIGEAIITSPFVEFPLPVKVFKFENLLKEKKELQDINWGVG